MTTKDGEDTATFRGYEIGYYKGQIGGSFRGSIFYKSPISTNGKLSFLNSKVEFLKLKWMDLKIPLKRFGNGNN